MASRGPDRFLRDTCTITVRTTMRGGERRQVSERTGGHLGAESVRVTARVARRVRIWAPEVLTLRMNRMIRARILSSLRQALTVSQVVGAHTRALCGPLLSSFSRVTPSSGAGTNVAQRARTGLLAANSAARPRVRLVESSHVALRRLDGRRVVVRDRVNTLVRSRMAVRRPLRRHRHHGGL